MYDKRGQGYSEARTFRAKLLGTNRRLSKKWVYN